MSILNNLRYTKINSGLVKLLVLSFGVRISEEILDNVSNDDAISKSNYYYDASNSNELCKKYNLPSEILYPDDVESSFYINQHSPLQIVKCGGDKLLLTYFDAVISPIEFNQRPNFSDVQLSDGTYGKQYASMYGRHILGLFLSGYCDYPAKGKVCRFCSIKSTLNDLGKRNIYALSASKIGQLINLMTKKDRERIKYVMYTAGTYPDVDRGIITQGLIIKSIIEKLPTTVGHHLTTMPPKDFSKIKILKEIGLNTLAYDIEVYSEDLFRYYCPGKDKLYGRQRMFDAIEYGISIFGYTNLKVGLVGGLEPIESMKKGMERFAAIGAGISINVFHPDANTEMEQISRPSPEYLLKMVEIQRDLYKQYKLVPVFPEGGRRSSLDSEVYRGFFDFI